MNEKKEIFRTIGRFAIVFLFALCYCLGGTEDMGGKWIRRYLGPAILCLGMFLYSRSWKSLIQAPIMVLTLSLGYGGTDLEWLKIVKRAFWGACNGLSSGFSGILEKRFWLPVAQTVILTGICVLLGVWNVLPNARIEEFTIGVFIALLPMMSARGK
jgi:phosphoglycerol transferase MdoB-like AlkP superfamily enzyme